MEKDIVVRVTDNTTGREMSVDMPMESLVDDWESVFKSILCFLTYNIDRVKINTEENK